MKKIFFTLAVVFAVFGIQSCSLHDDTDLFGESAAERIENAVKEDKALLEGASNGWILRYYTGTEYAGGGYTMLCKFKDGKAEVSADFIDDVNAVSHSSYDIITDKGPVLTFDTFNDIIHMMGSPSQSDIDGEQGDYEFVIQKTTNDSIYLEGKKWHNKMVMVRMDENTSWADYLKEIQSVGDALVYNNRICQGNDSVGIVEVDNAIRRLTVKTTVNGKKDSLDVPFYVTPEGVHVQQPVKIGDAEVSQFKFDKTTNELSPVGAPSGYSLQSFFPEGYKPIKFWYGDWYLVYRVADSQGNPTGQYAGYTMKLEPYDDASYVKATINLQGKKYEFYFEYSRKNGTLNMFSSYIEDPDGIYYYLMMAPVSFLDGGYFNFKGSLVAKWNDAQNAANFTWDKVGSYAIDSFVLMAADSSGEPVYDENGSLTVVQQIAYIVGMQRIE